MRTTKQIKVLISINTAQSENRTRARHVKQSFDLKQVDGTQTTGQEQDIDNVKEKRGQHGSPIKVLISINLMKHRQDDYVQFAHPGPSPNTMTPQQPLPPTPKPQATKIPPSPTPPPPLVLSSPPQFVDGCTGIIPYQLQSTAVLLGSNVFLFSSQPISILNINAIAGLYC